MEMCFIVRTTHKLSQEELHRRFEEWNSSQTCGLCYYLFRKTSWLYPGSECGHMCSHIRKIQELESSLEIVELTDIKDKYGLIDSLKE